MGLLATGTAGAPPIRARSSTTSSPSRRRAPARTTPGVDDSTIKVGTIVPTSGPFALFYAQTLDGIKARIAQANAEGELGKRKIELVNVDDAGDAARNVTAAQQLAEQDKVFGIITESNAGDASGEYLNDQKMPVVGWQLGLPVYGTYPNYFGMQNANTKNIKNEFTSRNADVIKALGGTKLAIIGSNAANSVVFTEQVKSAANKTKGLKTVYINHDIPVGTTEFGSVADQIKQSGADSMYTALDNAGNTGLMSGAEAGRREAEAGHLPRRLQPARARPARPTTTCTSASSSSRSSSRPRSRGRATTTSRSGWAAEARTRRSARSPRWAGSAPTPSSRASRRPA